MYSLGGESQTHPGTGGSPRCKKLGSIKYKYGRVPPKQGFLFFMLEAADEKKPLKIKKGSEEDKAM